MRREEGENNASCFFCFCVVLKRRENCSEKLDLLVLKDSPLKIIICSDLKKTPPLRWNCKKKVVK